MPSTFFDRHAQYYRNAADPDDFILSSSGDEVELVLLLLASFFLITLIFNQIVGNCKCCATLGAYQISLWLKTKAFVWIYIKRGYLSNNFNCLRVSVTTKSRISTASNGMNS